MHKACARSRRQPQRLAFVLLGAAAASALCVAVLTAGQTTPSSNQLNMEALAEELIELSPVADDADAKARDEAGLKLAHCDLLLDACGDTVLWGGFDPLKGYHPRAYALTLFAPMQWAKMYLSQFMFTGEYEIRNEGPFEVLELSAKFRGNLDAGDYPYPFWHSATKWQAYLHANSIIFVAQNNKIVAAFRGPNEDPELPTKKWDGRWHWTNEQGEQQPRVALFSYLFSDDNPHRPVLEETYRKLERQMRNYGCTICHSPDNSDQADPLILLLYPNQALGARHEILNVIKFNEMPPADPLTGAGRGIRNEQFRLEMEALAETFASEGDAAIAFERQAGLPDEGDGAKIDDKAAQVDQWKMIRDNWYSLTLAGVHSGWMRVVREDDGSRYRTVTEMSLRSQIAGTSLDADSYAEWIETHDGDPIKLSTARKNKEKRTNFDIGDYSAWEETRAGDPLGLLVSKREWEFHGDQVTRIEQLNGEIIRSTMPAPGGPWRTPVAAERFISHRINDEARAIEYGTLDAPELLRYVSVRSQFIGADEFPLDGELIPVTVWRTRTSVNPAQTISHYSSDGRLMYSSVNLGVGVLETRLCSKEEAQASLKPNTEARVELPVVRPDKPLVADTLVTYQIRLADGALPALPTAGAQTVTLSDDGNTAKIIVDVNSASTATSAELVYAQFKEGAPVQDANQTLMHELGAQSLRETQGLANRELALASHTVVHRHFAQQAVSNHVGPVGGAVLRVGGNSAEQARLLSDVLRVHRIPSRIVSGLAYAPQPLGDDVFVWRQWVQALIEGRWVDLDPVTSEPFNAGHILTGVGGMGNAVENPDPLDFESLLGKVQIQVISQQ